MYTYQIRVGREDDRRYKLSVDDIEEIKSMYSTGYVTRKELAEMFEVSVDTIRYYTDERWRNRPARIRSRNNREYSHKNYRSKYEYLKYLREKRGL